MNKAGHLLVEASGDLPLLDFEKGAAIRSFPMSSNEFFVDGGDHTRLAFLRDGADATMRLVLNPGPWQITGQRITDHRSRHESVQAIYRSVGCVTSPS